MAEFDLSDVEAAKVAVERAARWFEERNQVDWGFEHYMSAGLIERAAKISDRVANMYFAQGKVETLLKWRAQLGQIGIFAPGLLYNCARVHTDRYNYEEAEQSLNEAERRAERDRQETAEQQGRRAGGGPGEAGAGHRRPFEVRAAPSLWCEPEYLT